MLVRGGLLDVCIALTDTTPIGSFFVSQMTHQMALKVISRTAVALTDFFAERVSFVALRAVEVTIEVGFDANGTALALDIDLVLA